MKSKKTVSKKKLVPSGVAHVLSTFNNTIITISDATGNVVASSSAGARGFKGSKKSTPYAAQLTAEHVAKKAVDELGMKTVGVRVNGPGTGKESAVRALSAAGLTLTSIKDITPIPHNGCRPRKRRRV